MTHLPAVRHASFVGTLRVALWSTLAVACASVLVVRSARSREYFAAVEARRSEHVRLVEETGERIRRDRARESEVRTLLHGHDRGIGAGVPPQREPRREEVQRVLNGGGRFRVLHEGDGFSKEAWVDPVTGHEWELRFRHGTLSVAFVSRHATAMQPPPPRPLKEPQKDRFEVYRRLLVGFFPWHGLGPGAWLLSVVVWRAARRYRRPLSELVLMSALICTTFWLAHPGFVGFTSWKSIFSNDPLLWAALMLAASVACVVTSYRFRPAGPDVSHPSEWQTA